MRKFDRSEEGNAELGTPPSERLERFSERAWKTLDPSHDSPSVQARLMHASSAVYVEYMRNGAGNYYELYDEGERKFAEAGYSKLLVFMLDTLIANRGDANEKEDVEYFRALREAAEADWLRERTPEEGPGIDFEELYDRAVRCIANYCIANPDPIDESGSPIAGAPSLRPLLVS